MKKASNPILDDLRKPEKGPVTLYISKEIFAAFKKQCESVPPSRVLERLMVDFMKPKKAA